MDRFASYFTRKMATGPVWPVMRFRLVDKEQRLLSLERMTYRGEGGWHSLWDVKTWPPLARKYLQHLGKESVFDLV